MEAVSSLYLGTAFFTKTYPTDENKSSGKIFLERFATKRKIVSSYMQNDLAIDLTILNAKTLKSRS